MGIVVREMMLQDIEQVMDVEYASFIIPWSKESFAQELTNNEHAIYIVATQNNKVSGYCGMWIVLDEGHITNVAVHPKYRRMKIASALINSLIDIAKSECLRTVTLEVRESNVAAQKLYSKFGFKFIGKRKKYYSDNNEDAFIMTVRLPKHDIYQIKKGE